MTPVKIHRRNGWSVRYYLCAEGELRWRITNVLHRQWHDGVAFPELANTKQKILEVFVGQGRDHKPVLLDARGNIFSFNSEGILEVGSLVDIVGIELAEGSRVERNVIDIWPTILHKRWISEHIWMPTPIMLHALNADLASTATSRAGRIRTLGKGMKQSKL